MRARGGRGMRSHTRELGPAAGDGGHSRVSRALTRRDGGRVQSEMEPSGAMLWLSARQMVVWERARTVEAIAPHTTRTITRSQRAACPSAAIRFNRQRAAGRRERGHSARARH